MKDVSNTFNLLMISEIKIDSSFPRGQIFVEGVSEPYKIYRVFWFMLRKIDAQKCYPLFDPLPAEWFFVNHNSRKRILLVSYLCNTNINNSSVAILNRNVDVYLDAYYT